MKTLMLSATVLTMLTGVAAAQSTLRVASTSDITSINPGVDRSGFTDQVHMNIVEGLVGYKDDLSVGPVLATDINVSDDGLTYTFPLREGVSFHNGEPMTAADVVSSWERLMLPETNWRCRDRFSGEDGIEVTSVTALDDFTVEYKISEPSPLFLKDLARFDCGSTPVMHADSVGGDGAWDKPIGTGPFRFVEWRPGQRVVLEKFDGYTSPGGDKDGYTGDKTPLIDRIMINVVPDAASAKAAMRAGEVDLYALATADIEEMEAAGFEVVFEQTPAWGTFLISRHNAFMDNQPLRQAMAKALNVDQLAELMGYESANATPIPPISSFFTEAQKATYGHDLEAAKALLEEAGYNGEPIQLITSRRSKTMYDQAVVAQAMWQQAGLNIEIEVLEWGTQLDRYRDGEYQVMSFGFSSRLDPALSWDMFSGPQQRKVWSDPAALELIGQLKGETDEAKRAAISDELMGLFLEQVPAIGLYSQPAAVVISDRVENFTLWPGGTLRFWNVTVD